MIAILHKISEFSRKCRERGERSAETSGDAKTQVLIDDLSRSDTNHNTEDERAQEID
jgi:hypothetical protein